MWTPSRSVHQTISPSVQQSTSLSVQQSISPAFQQSISPPFQQSISPSVHHSISPSARLSVYDLNLLYSRHEIPGNPSLQQITSCPAKISSLNISLVTGILQLESLKKFLPYFFKIFILSVTQSVPQSS